ncbi:RICIN domain-containing protein [Streptomyces sp. NPDC048297]|uniref:RICIN domain-containing protein n=1 Tax=Streptomyces sp. NPDC048297 TaxID=3365531 RepID=UPI00371ABB4D
MFTPHPPRPAYPPPGVDPMESHESDESHEFGESDESVAAPLRAGSDAEASRAAALLMARHWRPAHDYAVICLATPGPLAHMVTAATFHQVLDRLTLGESAEALRPRLLVAVRDTVVDWAATRRTTTVLPGLDKPAGGRGMRAAKTLIAENRALSARSFQGLPRFEQTLLWHTEVEAEPINVPASLLGLDSHSAANALEQAREKFREGCVRAHRELAPNTECRHYNRLLDVPLRRDGGLLPDVRRHLADCAYCRHAAEQLGRIDAGSGVLLAEAVLGWGARRYLDSRPGRTRANPARAHAASRRSHGRRRGGDGPGPAARTTAPGGRRRGGSGTALFARIPAPSRTSGTGWSSRTLLSGVGIASAGLLVTVLAVGAWPDGGDGTAPVATTGAAPGTDASAPSAPSGPSSFSASAGAPAPGTAGLPSAGRPTRLRNTGTALCLDIKGPPRADAGTVLAACSSARTQQWTYDADGLLHSAADPALCLDSHADAGVVILGTCAEDGTRRGDDVRYDLTAQGELLPRWDRTLALAPAGARPGADLVVTVRNRSTDQRWGTGAPSTGPGSFSAAGGEGESAWPSELPHQGT